MNTYGVVLFDRVGPEIVEADYFELKDGFINFYKETKEPEGYELFAVFNAVNVDCCVLQQEFTEEEVIEQIINNSYFGERK